MTEPEKEPQVKPKDANTVSPSSILCEAVTVTILIFGAYELIPKYGASATVALSVLLLCLWISRGGVKRAKEEWNKDRRIWKLFKSSWELILALVILIITAGFYVADKLPFTWGRPIYRLEVGHQIPIPSDGIQEVTDKYPVTPNESNLSDIHVREKFRFHIWRLWMGKGAPMNGGHLYCVKSEKFKDDYARMDVQYSLASGYKVSNAVAFLESDACVSSKDLRHRPVLRQMRVEKLSDQQTVQVAVERPSRGERVLLLLQVEGQNGSLDPVDIDKCFIHKELEVP